MDAIITFIAQYLYLFALLIGAALFFFQPRSVQKSMIVCGVIVAPVAYVLSRIAGFLYYDPRPFVVGHFIPLIAHSPDNGFPSDHVLLAGAVAMVVWFYNKKVSAILWALAIVIGWARVASGIHHVADIAGSIALVLIAGATYYFATHKKYYQCKECGSRYRDRGTAEKCQAWCSEHKSCNLEIIKRAVKSEAKG